jgi:hypothetical protein
MYDSPGLSVSPGIAGTDTPRALSIELYTQNHANAHLKINFWDYPGGLLNPESSTGAEANAFQARINDAHYFFVIVDAPALLEHDGRFHAIRNYPYPIQYMLHNSLGSDPRGAKVLFVVVKCEKYVKEGRSQEVFRAIQKGYSNLFSDIQASHQSSADICLVETLGSIVLDRLEPVMTASGQEYPRYHFKKISQIFIIFECYQILCKLFDLKFYLNKKKYDFKLIFLHHLFLILILSLILIDV